MSEPPAVVGLVDSREQRDDAYRAIGRYTVEFSLLVAGMREIIAVHITDEQKRDAAQLVLGSLMAQQVADPFFAICRAVGELRVQLTGLIDLAAVRRDASGVNQRIHLNNAGASIAPALAVAGLATRIGFGRLQRP